MPSQIPSLLTSDKTYVPQDQPSEGPVIDTYPGEIPAQFISTVKVISYIHEPSSLFALDK